MGEEVRRNYIWSYLVILKVVDVCLAVCVLILQRGS